MLTITQVDNVQCETNSIIQFPNTEWAVLKQNDLFPVFWVNSVQFKALCHAGPLDRAIPVCWQHNYNEHSAPFSFLLIHSGVRMNC